MPRQVLEFRIVVASPSDVFETRKAAFNAIHELDRIFEVQNVAVRGLGWEEYASPGVDVEAQSIINKQVLREYDVLVALFGTTLGTPTKSERSGTVEEIEHAIAKKDSRIGPRRVQVYFCDKIANISRVSLTDLKRIEDYRENLSTRGVFYRQFVDDDELQREVRINIQRLIIEYLNSSGQGDTDSSATVEKVQTTEQRTAVPQQTKQDDDFGILDLQEKAQTASAAGTAAIQAIATLIEEISVETDRSVKEIEKVSSPLVSLAEKKKVVNSFAESLKSRAAHLKQEAVSAKSHFTNYFDTLSLAVKMEQEYADPTKFEADFQSFRNHAEPLMKGIAYSRDSIRSFMRSVESIPRVTIQFNQAKKLLIDALADCVQMSDEAERGLLSILARK